MLGGVICQLIYGVKVACLGVDSSTCDISPLLNSFFYICRLRCLLGLVLFCFLLLSSSASCL